MKACICGWYGTETLGDRAILAIREYMHGHDFKREEGSIAVNLRIYHDIGVLERIKLITGKEITFFKIDVTDGETLYS